MPVSFTACTQKARLTEASIAFQQDSIFIATCWNHLCANKTGNLFKEKILLKIVCLHWFFTLSHFLYLHLDKIKMFILFTSGENKKQSILYVNVMRFIMRLPASRNLSLFSWTHSRFVPLFFLTQQSINTIWQRNCAMMPFHKPYFSYH